MDFHVSAIRTLTDVIAKVTGFAVEDRTRSFVLNARRRESLHRKGFIGRFKYLADLITTHGVHLSSQTT